MRLMFTLECGTGCLGHSNGLQNFYLLVCWWILLCALTISRSFRVVATSGLKSMTPRLIHGKVRSSRVPAKMSPQMENRSLGSFEFRKQSSVNLNGLFYIHSEIESILVYDINKDIWSTLRKPQGDVESMCKCIGTWQGQLFGVRECFEPDSIVIWELASPSKRWKKYNQMPANLYKWLYYIQGSGFADVQIHASFSSHYILIYSCLCQENRAEKFVLFDLATKSWKAYYPFGNLEEPESPKEPESEPGSDDYAESTEPTDSSSSDEDDDSEGYEDEESDEYEEYEDEEEIVALP